MRSQVQLPKNHIMKLTHFVMLTFQKKTQQRKRHHFEQRCSPARLVQATLLRPINLVRRANCGEHKSGEPFVTVFLVGGFSPNPVEKYMLVKMNYFPRKSG